MFARLGMGLVLGALAASPIQVMAHTSSAAVVTDVQSPGATPPTPAKPLDISDNDYPIESLLLNEDGHTILGLNVDSQGRVTSAQRLMSSGSARLDLRATQLARTWLFKPATKDGQPTPASMTVDVSWKLPLHPIDDLNSDMMGFPVAGKAVVPPKPIPETHAMTSRDYPVQSLRRSEQGEVALRALVAEDGSVADVQTIDSSGFSALDQSAITMAQRFKYEPATVDGKVTPISFYILVRFQLASTQAELARANATVFCHSHPMIGSTDTISNGAAGGIQVTEWVHATTAGTIDDVILQTASGWMRFSAPLIQATSLTLGKGLAVLANRQIPSTGSLIEPSRATRATACWYQLRSH
jgi:protein TonB